MRIAAYLQDELTNSTDEQYDAIKNAGWNTLILGLIHVEAPNPYNNPPIYGGTLYFNGGKAFEYGEYTGTPDFTDRVNGLITISRIFNGCTKRGKTPKEARDGPACKAISGHCGRHSRQSP